MAKAADRQPRPDAVEAPGSEADHAPRTLRVINQTRSPHTFGGRVLPAGEVGEVPYGDDVAAALDAGTVTPAPKTGVERAVAPETGKRS